ncbi:MAG: chorismate synthase, partial [Parachlamydiaceae bacterium]
GAVAKKLLGHYGIRIIAYLKKIGTLEANLKEYSFETLASLTLQSPIFCPDVKMAPAMTKLIEETKAGGDSLGGLVEFVAHSLPVGLGDPIYEKLEAKLAHAMMSLPATKGFEIGSGFSSTEMLGSSHNDCFIHVSGEVKTITNHAGGTLGGISTGMPLVGRVAFKPTSSIMKPQETVTLTGENATFQLPQGSRHDPCVAIRAVPIVEAMTALVLADALLLNRCIKL